MIKTTIKQLGESTAALQLLVTAALPVKTAYVVGKLIKEVQKELTEFSEARNKIFTDAKCEVKDNQYVHENPEVLSEALSKIDELASLEITFSISPLKYEQLGSLTIDVGNLMMLEWIFEKEE